MAEGKPLKASWNTTDTVRRRQKTWRENKLDRLHQRLTALTAPVHTESVMVPDEHQSNQIIRISWESLGGDAGLNATCTFLLYML